MTGLIEADADTYSEFGGRFPSITHKPRNGRYTFYTNLPASENVGGSRLRLFTSELKGTKWEGWKVYGVRPDSNTPWLFYATRGTATSGETSRGGRKLTSTSKWVYLKRGTLGGENFAVDKAYIDEDFVSTGNENRILRLTGNAPAEMLGNMERNADRAATAFEEEVSAERTAFSALTTPDGSGLSFATVTALPDNSTIFHLNAMPFKPDSSWPASREQWDESLTVLEQARAASGTKLAFLIDKNGNVRLPLTDNSDPHASEGEQIGAANYALLKRAFATPLLGTPKPDELLNMVKRAKLDAIRSFRGGHKIPAIELGAAVAGGPVLSRGVLSHFLAATSQYYRDDKTNIDKRGDGATFLDLINSLTIKENKLRQAVTATPDHEMEDRLADVYADAGSMKLSGRDKAMMADLYDATKAFAGDEEFNYIAQSAGADTPVAVTLSGAFSSAWTLIPLYEKGKKGDPKAAPVRGVLVPPVSSSRQDFRNQLIRDVENSYKNNFDVGDPVGFDYRLYLLRKAQEAYDHPPVKIRREAWAALPPINLSIKMDTVAGANTNAAVGLTDMKGEYTLATGSKAKGPHRSIGHLARAYMYANDNINTQERQYLHNLFDLRYADDEKPSEKLERSMEIHGQATAFRERETVMHNVSDAMLHAAQISDVGGALVDAFRDGIIINKDGKDRMFMFDEAGVLYEVNPNEPHNTDYWEPVPATVFNDQSPYMVTLRGIAAMVEAGQPFASKDGIRAAAAKTLPHEELNFGRQGGKFLAWHRDLVQKVEAATTGSEDYLQQMQALMALPTIQVTPGKVFDIDAEKERTAYLVATAVGVNPSSLHPSLHGTRLEQVARLLKPGKATMATASLTAEAADNYRLFSKWVRSTYLEQLQPGGTFEGEPVSIVKDRLARQLYDRVLRIGEASRYMAQLSEMHRPDVLDDKARFEDSFLGRVSEKVLNATLRPLIRWIQDSWEDVTTIISHLWGIVTSPLDFLGRTVPAALVSLELATKVFFQSYFYRVIEDEFHDREITRSDGSKRMVSFTKVKRAARSFLSDGLNLKPYTSHSFNKVSEIAGTGEYANTMGLAYGTRVAAAYVPIMQNEKVIREQTLHKPERVAMRGYQTRKGNPGMGIGVVVPVLDPQKIGLNPALIEQIREFGPRGANLTGERPDRVSPELRAWFTAFGGNFNVRQFRNVNGKGGPSRVSPDPSEFKLKVDHQGNVNVEMMYKLQHVFPNNIEARRAYAAIYGREVTSSDPHSYGAQRKRQPVGYDDYDNVIQMRGPANESDDLQRKLNLIEALFGV